MGSMRSAIQISSLLLCIAAFGMAQADKVAAGAWTQVDRSDPLHRTSFKEFTLAGKFLVSPRQSSRSAPVLVLHCQPGPRRVGKSQTNGHFVEGWIATGAVLNSSAEKIAYGARVSISSSIGTIEDVVPVVYRLDNKELKSLYWRVSTDHSGILFDDGDLDDLLYGHVLRHKEGTNAQIQRIMLGVPEYLAAQIQMQFDFPDSTEVAEACGIITHKNR